MFVHQHIRLWHLRTFLEVSKTRSIGRAAYTLTVTQPAVSKIIRELEAILGIKLFNSSRRTPPLGTKFLIHAENSLLSLKQGIEEITQARSPEAPPFTSAPCQPFQPGCYRQQSAITGPGNDRSTRNHRRAEPLSNESAARWRC